MVTTLCASICWSPCYCLFNRRFSALSQLVRGHKKDATKEERAAAADQAVVKVTLVGLLWQRLALSVEPHSAGRGGHRCLGATLRPGSCERHTGGFGARLHVPRPLPPHTSTQWNTGDEAYKRDLLGPTFTVVKKINSSGTGGSVEVYDCQGRVVSGSGCPIPCSRQQTTVAFLATCAVPRCPVRTGVCPTLRQHAARQQGARGAGARCVCEPLPCRDSPSTAGAAWGQSAARVDRRSQHQLQQPSHRAHTGLFTQRACCQCLKGCMRGWLAWDEHLQRPAHCACTVCALWCVSAGQRQVSVQPAASVAPAGGLPCRALLPSPAQPSPACPLGRARRF